jgi:chromosome partitioning protein
MRVITVTNHKGGVGKTTTVITIGDGLARLGKRVLLLDLDPQGHIASSLNVECKQSSHLLFNLPDHSAATVEYLKRYFVSARDNLWIMPGGNQLEAAQASLAVSRNPIQALRETLGMMTDLFDYVVIDTAPSRGGIQERAIFAADIVVIPSSPRFLSIQGARDTMIIIDELVKAGWRGLLLGILPTFFEANPVDARTNMEDLKTSLGNIVLEPIHTAEAITRASTNGMTIFEWDKNSRSAKEYENLINRILWVK